MLSYTFFFLSVVPSIVIYVTQGLEALTFLAIWFVGISLTGANSTVRELNKLAEW